MRFLLLVMLVLAVPLSTEAQFSSFGLEQSGSKISVSPTHPSPFQEYEVTLEDYGGNVYGAEIYWYVNDRLLEEATGQRSVKLTARESGSKDVIKLVLKTQEGGTTLTTTIRPLYLDIIVEPQTHVPNFYQGRPLASVGSSVNLTALVNGSATNNAQYVYTWRVNNVVLEAGPLRGRNEISFTMPQDSNSVISLNVTALDGTPVASRSITVPVVAPKLLFYEVSTLYGIEYRAIDKDLSLLGNSITLRAEPYFLSSTVFNDPDIITWSVANKDMSATGANPYEVTLQKTGFPGITNVGFHVRSTDILLQGARSNLNVSI